MPLRWWRLLAIGSVAVVLLAVVVLPWHRSGDVERTALGLAQVAENLGLVASWWRRGLFVAVQLVPLLAAATLLAVLGGWSRATGIGAFAAGAVGLASAAVVVHVTDQVVPGSVVAAAAAVPALVAGARLARGGDHHV